MKKILFIIIITLFSYNLLKLNAQCPFYNSIEYCIKCDTAIIHFDEDDSLLISKNIFWSISIDSIKFNTKYYFPFLFSFNNANDTLGYIRYFDNNILIIPLNNIISSREDTLFKFSDIGDKWALPNIESLSDSIKISNIYFSNSFKEKIYVYSFNVNPLKTAIKELHIGRNIGIIKAIFHTHFRPININCINLKKTK